jgi:ANTAR domain/GAF domain
MSDSEPFAETGYVDLATADARDVTADDRERLADGRDELANERAGLADLRDSLADQREHELMQLLGDGAGSAGGVAARSEVAQMAFALDRVRMAEAAIRRAELDRAQAQEALDLMVARRQRDHAREERDDALRAMGEIGAVGEMGAVGAVGAGSLDERAWAQQRRDFVAFERERTADARDQAADSRDKTADEREDAADARDRILRRWEDEVRRSGHGGRLRQAAVQASRLDLAVVRRMAEQRRSAQLGVAGGGSRPAPPQPSGTGPAENGSLLTASFAALAQELITESALAPALQRLLTLMVGVVAGCDCASIWFVAGTETGPNVATDDSAATLDAVQFHEREGPAVAALSARTPVYVADLSRLGDGLLPAAADAASVSSALCLGLSVKRSGAWQSLGVISLYGPDCDAFCEADREIVEVFAAFAAAMIDLEQTRRDLRQREAALHRSLSTRDIIGQAKGILMERERLSAGQAFDRLRRASQGLNVKLSDIAWKLTETGELGSR